MRTEETVGKYYVQVDEVFIGGNGSRILFRMYSPDKLQASEAKDVQRKVGYPANKHGFDDFCVYRDELGGWQSSWYCSSKAVARA